MTAVRYFLLKYMKDPKRREPINVGVAVEAPDGWHLHFLGESPDGGIETPPRWTQLRRDVYEGWVGYYRRKAEEDRWNDVELLHQHRPGNFYAELGGYQDDSDARWEVLTRQLFDELVDRPAMEKMAPKERLESRVDRLLQRAGVINVVRDVTVPGKYGDHTVEIPFGYQYVNGGIHLMDVLGGSSVGRLARDARELQSRIVAAREAGSANEFVTFVSTAGLKQADFDRVLFPAESASNVVDADNEAGAVGQIKELLVHP